MYKHMMVLDKPPLLIIRDSLTGVWLFYGLVVGGLLAAACRLGLCADARFPLLGEDYAIIALGLACALTGLIMTPFTTVRINRDEGTIFIQRRGVLRREKIMFPLSEVRDAAVLESEGSEGTGYQLNLEMSNGQLIPLSTYWAANRNSADQATESIRSLLRKTAQN